MNMDSGIQTGLIYVGIVIVIAVVLFAISFLGIKEKTYEEAIAEQRSLPSEHLLLGRSEKDKNKEKKLKKAGKKVKEKPAERETSDHPKTSREPAIHHGKGHVEFVQPEAEVIGEQPPQKEDLQAKNSGTSGGEVSTAKAVNSSKGVSKTEKASLSKNEKGAVPKAENIPAPKSASKQEKMPASKVEKTSTAKVEKTPASKVEKTSPKMEKVEKQPVPKEKPANTKTEKVAAQRVEKETVASVVENAPLPASVVNKEQRNRKKKSEMAALQQMSGDREAVNISLIVVLLQKAELSPSEIQNLIDLLLNKLQGSAVTNAEWVEGRQDPMMKLKKQLAEKEKALSEEQEASQAFQSKLKELRTELNQERSRLTHSCRQMEEAAAAKQVEAQHLATRLQHALDTHATEKQSLTQQVQQLQAKINEDHQLLRKLQEEQGQTQGVLQQELLSQRQQLELHIAHLSEQHQEADSAYKNQLNQLHGQLHEQEAINNNLNAELQGVQENSMGRDNENKMMRDRIAHLENQLVLAENQSRDMGHKLEELHHINTNLDHCMNKSMRCESVVKHENDSLRKECDALKDAYSKLADLKIEAGRLQSENEKMAVSVKELQAESQHAREEKERLSSKLSESVRDSQQLREENESLAAQVTAVTERPAAEGRENGDIQEEKLAQKEAVSLDKVVKQKDAELLKLASELTTFKTEFRKVSDELEAQKQKNNALRTRNWNAMEALSSTEKVLETHVKQSQKLVTETTNTVRLEEQKVMKQLLQRIFPNIKVEDTKVHKTWVERFETCALSILADLESRPQKVSPSKVNTAELEELQAQNAKLQSMVDNYKTIIHDTEKLLNQLQANAEEEEIRWRAQFQKKEAELDQMTDDRNNLEQALEHVKGAEQMQTKLKELQDKLHSEEIEKQNLAKQFETMRSRIAGKGDAPDLSAVVEKLSEENTRLSYELQSAHEKESETAKEMVKLKGLLQIGQDSLDQEQKVSEQLKSQVDKLNGVNQNHAVATNGAATESSISEGGSGKK